MSDFSVHLLFKGQKQKFYESKKREEWYQPIDEKGKIVREAKVRIAHKLEWTSQQADYKGKNKREAKLSVSQLNLSAKKSLTLLYKVCKPLLEALLCFKRNVVDWQVPSAALIVNFSFYIFWFYGRLLHLSSVLLFFQFFVNLLRYRSKKKRLAFSISIFNLLPKVLSRALRNSRGKRRTSDERRAHFFVSEAIFQRIRR